MKRKRLNDDDHVIFVSGFDKKHTVRDVHKCFSKYGKIKDVIKKQNSKVLFLVISWLSARLLTSLSCFPVASYQTIDEVNGASFHTCSFQKLLEPFFFQFYVCFENRQVAEHMIALGSVKFEEITITIKVSSLIFHENLRQQLSK